MFTIKVSNVSLWKEPVPLSSLYSDWTRRLQILLKLKRILLEDVNGVNRLATNGKKYYRLPTKREKKLPTTDMDRHYLFFSTFLGSNQRYHVTITSLFINIPQNEGTEIGLQSVWKFLQSNRSSPTHYMREMLRLILSSSMESSTYKPTVPQWAQRQQFPLPTFSCRILKHKV